MEMIKIDGSNAREISHLLSCRASADGEHVSGEMFVVSHAVVSRSVKQWSFITFHYFPLQCVHLFALGDSKVLNQLQLSHSLRRLSPANACDLISAETLCTNISAYVSRITKPCPPGSQSQSLQLEVTVEPQLLSVSMLIIFAFRGKYAKS